MRHCREFGSGLLTTLHLKEKEREMPIFCNQCRKDLDLCDCEPEGGIIVPATPKTFLVAFESGHYKRIEGFWKGDSVWAHWFKENDKMIHINKDLVEYIEEI